MLRTPSETDVMLTPDHGEHVGVTPLFFPLSVGESLSPRVRVCWTVTVRWLIPDSSLQ